MTILTTNTEILMYALDVADEPQSANSDFYTPAIGFMNSIYRQICAGGVALNPDIDEKWLWLRSPRPGVIILQPSFQDTASFVFNGAAVALDNPPAYSLEDWVFHHVSGNGDYYRVLTHVAADPNVTLDSVFTGETGSGDVKAFQLLYDLPDDCQEVLGAMRAPREENKIEGIDPDGLLEDFPFNQFETGVPSRYAMTAENKVMFSGYAGDDDQLLRIEFDYALVVEELGDDTNEPLIPLPYRASVLGEFTAFYILQDKHDNKAERIGQLAQAGLIAMASENRRRISRQGSDLFGQIRPRRPPPAGRRGPLRTASGSIIG